MSNLRPTFIKIIIQISVLLKHSAKLQELRPTVTLQQGVVVGVKVYLSRVTINAFLGIPYAEPPVGQLRFAVPEKHKGWTGNLFAGNYAPLCPYYISNFEMSDKEDCLYLNIWTSGNVNNKLLLPVMVYLSSDPIQIPGHDLAAEGIVLVSVSYRQNIFGSFCLGTAEARGNLGLLDQYMALLWVKENIAKFGGDKNLVTIIGHSDSAAAVIYHMASPRARGMFNKGIIMSGNSFSPWNNHNSIEISLKVKTDLGCASRTVRSSLECLRAKSVQELLRAFGRYSKDTVWSVLPVVDTFLAENDRYLPIEPYAALVNGTYLKIPILTGTTDYITDYWERQDKNYNQLRHMIEEMEIPNIMRQYKFDGPNKNLIKTTIIWKYLDSILNGDIQGLIRQIHNLFRDSRVTAPTDRLLKLLITTSQFPIYSYYLHLSKSTTNISESTVGGELLLLFGPQLLQQFARRRFTSDEERLSKKLKMSWVAFAQKGSPVTSNYGEQWKPYNSNNKQVHQFGDDRNLSEFRSDINFWNELLPHITNMLSQTNSLPQEFQVSPDPAAGFRQAMYTLVGLVVALLVLLLICVVLLKRKVKERKGHLGSYH